MRFRKKTVCGLVKGLGTKIEKEKEMSGTKDSRNGRSTGETLRIVKERLNDADTYLTNFFFRYGANVYVLSYEKEGERRHTFIDAGDLRYHKQMLPMLIENDIDPNKIERIIITHRHRDHVGLARLLATGSGAKITVHSNFRSFVEGEISEMERKSIGSRLIEHLRQQPEPTVRKIVEQDVALLKRFGNAPDRLAEQVDLFPLPGFTPGTCGLILSHLNATTLIAGDAVATVEHLEQGRVLKGAFDVSQARESLAEAMEIADVIVPGHDNVLLNPSRRPV